MLRLSPINCSCLLLPILFLALPGPAGVLQAQTPEPAVIRGTVTDGAGAPLYLVNVQIAGTVDGSFTDEEGRFRFISYQFGEREIRATMIGCEPASRTIVLAPGDTVHVTLMLAETTIPLEDVVVAASTYTTGETETVTLRSLEVLTTPGAAADIFLAIKTFPGVAMVDEGAGLFIRGGDISETVTLLDQATVVHPYRFESPTGGVFGAIPPFLVGGTVFSTGGFSAKYGNALSGVLAMDSQNMPDQPHYYTNLGLAAASVGIDLPLVADRLGLRFSGNRSFTGLMFRLNGHLEDFTTTPRGVDGNLSLIYQYSPTGRIKLFNFVTTDRLGVHVDEPSFTGIYRGETTNWLHNIQLTEIRRDFLLQVSASLNRFNAQRRLGNLDLEPADKTWKLRADAERNLGDRNRLLIGGEIERTDNAFRGTIPVLAHVLDPAAEVFELDEAYAATRAGAYTELELNPVRHLVAGLGVRSDYHSLAREAVVDPRLNIRYTLSEYTNLRFALGIYHSFPSPYAFNPDSGNPELGPQRATHTIFGLNHERELLLIRLEAYRKPYRDLVLRHPDRNYINRGDGIAQGVDVFVKYGAFLLTRINGWLAYSYLQSRRLQSRHLGDDLSYDRGPSPFDITHNFTLVVKARLIHYLSGGFTYRYATGRPITPVTGAIPGAGGTYYLPVEGPVGSERLPAFKRLDTDFSYYLPFGRESAVILYLGISNLLNRANVLDYEYSVDFTERRERRTHYHRFIYFGATLQFNG